MCSFPYKTAMAPKGPFNGNVTGGVPDPGGGSTFFSPEFRGGSTFFSPEFRGGSTFFSATRRETRRYREASFL